MLRRLLMLLVCAVLVTLWTPPQSTIAQTDCPEGGCKVFLPAVYTLQKMRVVDWSIYVPRYCSDADLTIMLQNVGKERVTEFRIRGHLILNTTVRVDYDRVFTRQAVYPGGLVAVKLPVTDCTYATSGSFQVDDILVDHKVIATLNVLSTNKEGHYSCQGDGKFSVSGEVKNDTPDRVSVLAVQLGIYGTGQVRDSVLDPGETTAYTGTFALYQDTAGHCGYPDPEYTVQAWGEPIR